MHTISVRVDSETMQLIDEFGEGLTVSEKFRSIVDSMAYKKEFLEKKKREYELKLNEIERELSLNIFNKAFTMPESEKEFFVETKKVLDEKGRENPQIWHGRYNLYRNTFGRRITFEDFKLKLKELESGSA